MSHEFQIPASEEILKSILRTGRTPQQIQATLDIANQAIEEGRMRTDLTCWEQKNRFFDMAKRMYVDNDGMRPKDLEIGLHWGSCHAPLCRRTAQAYYEVLKPSTDEDSPKIAEFLTDLETELMVGKEITELKGKDTNYYDPNTGRPCTIAKAVDITDKCLIDKGCKGILVYMAFSDGMAIDIQLHDKEGLSASCGFRLNNFLAPDNSLEVTGELLGIDQQFLNAVVLANAPSTFQ